MKIDIQCTGFTLTDGIRASLMKRLTDDLNHGDDQVTRVIVRLSDINGPRGGVDKRCLIEVRLKHAPALVIEDTEADLYLAIDRATDYGTTRNDHDINHAAPRGSPNGVGHWRSRYRPRGSPGRS